MRYYRGEVSAYYPEHQLYRVVYEDGDSEEMEEEYVTMYLAAPPPKKKKSPDKKFIQRRRTSLAAAENMIEFAKSPPRRKNAAVVDVTSVSPETLRGRSEVVAPLERGCNLADVFDEQDDGDGEKIQVPEIDRLPIRNNLSFGLSDTESVDGIDNASGAVTDNHTDSNLNTDTGGAGEEVVTAKKPEQKHQKV